MTAPTHCIQHHRIYFGDLSTGRYNPKALVQGKIGLRLEKMYLLDGTDILSIPTVRQITDEQAFVSSWDKQTVIMWNDPRRIASRNELIDQFGMCDILGIE